MATFDYSPIAQYITLTYRCPECDNETTSDAMGVPMPNYIAERAGDSANDEDYQVICEHCGAAYDVLLTTRYDGGWGDITDIADDDLLDVNVEFPEDDYGYYDADDFEETKNEYASLIDKLTGLEEAELHTIYQLLYVNIIARMEAYLSDTLKKNVLKDDDSIRAFVEKFKDFETYELKLSDLFQKKDRLPKIIKEVLSNMMYHNLGKLKPIYKDILNVDMGDISNLAKAVTIRHHIVHRNGKDLEGNPITVTRGQVIKLWDQVSDLIIDIERQIAMP